MSVLMALLPPLTIALALVLVYRPFGDYMARVYTSPRDAKVERVIYRVIGVDSRRGQSWQAYARAVLTFSAVSLLIVYALQRLQAWLPFSNGLPAPSEHLAFNTAASFVGNTNWQSYGGESTLGYTVQFAGLAVQNFLSAAVGMSVAIALVRSFRLRSSVTIGNFWVDLVRGTTRILLPISVIGALLFVAGGVIQNFNAPETVQTIAGATQTLPGGPTASQEIIKVLGTNGGGFFNANSSHPFENPSALTNLAQVFFMLLIPFSLPRTFGKLVRDHRQGYAIVAVMALLFTVSYALLTLFESAGAGTAPELAGAAMEGKEQRLGIVASTLFSTTSTGTSTGAVAAMHDSYTSFGGMMPMLNMMLGEVSPGGVGSGLYAILVFAIIAVFLAGLLIGRTPTYLGKAIGPREIKLAALTMLTMPILVLTGTALTLGITPLREQVVTESLGNPGLHGLSEVLYAFTSAANNNGSAFAGLNANTPWLNIALGVTIILGRCVPIVFVLALAGSFAAQGHVKTAVGTLPTHRPLFVGLLTAVVLLLGALTFFPVLTLGPLAEGL